MKVLVGVVVVVLGAVVFCFLVLIGTNTLPNRPFTLIALERCVYKLSCRLTRFLLTRFLRDAVPKKNKSLVTYPINRYRRFQPISYMSTVCISNCVTRTTQKAARRKLLPTSKLKNHVSRSKILPAPPSPADDFKQRHHDFIPARLISKQGRFDFKQGRYDFKQERHNVEQENTDFRH